MTMTLPPLPVTVSMATTRERLFSAYNRAIEIFDGISKPERIVVNVSMEPYLIDDGLPSPDSMEKIFSDIPGVILRIVRNIGPHRKWYYTFRDRMSPFVLLIDDDVSRKSDFLKFMFDVFGHNSDKIISGAFSKELTKKVYDGKHIHFMDGNPGSLHDMRFIREEDRAALFDLDTIMRICPTSSEAWLCAYYAARRIETVICPVQVHGRTDFERSLHNCYHRMDGTLSQNKIDFCIKAYEYWKMKLKGDKDGQVQNKGC